MVFFKLLILFARRRLSYSQRRFASTTRVTEKRMKFSYIEDSDVSHFQQILGKSGVLTDKSDLETYNRDWLNTCHGSSCLLLKPSSTNEVSAIMKHCYGRHLAVCPQGGNTGLVGGSVPVFDEIIISTERLNKIIDINPLTGIAQVESGCVLEALDNALEPHGLMVPLDLGAKGSCHIGGNVSTNAGGLRLLKYGSMHANVVGVEAVLSDGRVMSCNTTALRKDNTGVDLKHLFIGSEGTLGIVTKVWLLCPIRPTNVAVAFLGFDEFGKVLEVFGLARQHLGEFLSAVEVMDLESLRCVRDNLGIHQPFDREHSYCLLVEASGLSDCGIEKSMSIFLEKVSHLISDGTMATEGSKIRHLWSLRERISESLRADGYCYKYDISVPLKQYMEPVSVLKKRVQGSNAKRVACFGHMGDSNVHLNVTSDAYCGELLSKIEPFIYEWTCANGGSISAEHGVGLLKKKYLPLNKRPEVLQCMKDIKNLMDPTGILNPYKVF